MIESLQTERRLDSAPGLEVTGLLQKWSGGDAAALERLVVLVYPELRRIASRCLAGERSGHTLQATALVNEAYLKLVEIHSMEWNDRVHFFAVGARIMRRILVDHARSKGYAKRGGGALRVDFNEALIVAKEADPTLVRMDDALTQLATFDPRKARIVEMRYFGGLNADDIAAVLGVSTQTVNRDWSLAKAWLAREMLGGDSETLAHDAQR